MNKKAEERIKSALKESKRELEHIFRTDSRERPVEAWCYNFLVKVLGYDKYHVDYQEKTCGNKAVDITIKDNQNQILWLCECKKISEKLGKWVGELQKYCCERNVKWGILTNGISWAIYHFYHEGNTPKCMLVYEVKDMLHIRNCKQDRKKLYPFCVEAIKDNLREEKLNEKRVLSNECFGRALISENVLKALKQQIRKTEGFKITEENLAKQIKKLIPQFKDLKISRKSSRKKSCRKINKQEEKRMEQALQLIN